MFDTDIYEDLKNGTLLVSKEIAPFINGSMETRDSVPGVQFSIQEILSIPVEWKNGEKVHVIGQETLVLTLSEGVIFGNCRLIIKSKIDLEVLCCKNKRHWKIRETRSLSTPGGRDLPATVNITVAEDEDD